MALLNSIGPGQVFPSTVDISASLGERCTVGAREFILVAASGSITLDQGTALAFDGTTLNTVDAATGAAVALGEIAGFVPAELDGVAVVSGDQFLLVRNGQSVLATNAAVAIGAALATAGTSGKVDDAAVTYDTACAYALEAAAGAEDIQGVVTLP